MRHGQQAERQPFSTCTAGETDSQGEALGTERATGRVAAPRLGRPLGIATGGAVPPPRDLDGRGIVRSIRRIEKYGASDIGFLHRRKVSRSPLKEEETEEREGEVEETVGADERAGQG